MHPGILPTELCCCVHCHLALSHARLFAQVLPNAYMHTIRCLRPQARLRHLHYVCFARQLEACMQRYWRASRYLLTHPQSRPWHARRSRGPNLKSSLYLMPCCPLFQTLTSFPFHCRACMSACMTACMRAPRHCKLSSLTHVRAPRYMPESIMHACCGLEMNKCSVGKVLLNDHKRYECALSGSRESTL